MNQKKTQARSDKTTRRDFLKTTGMLAAGAALSGGLSVARSAQAAGSGAIKIALIGAGGRGTGAAVNALNNASNPNVKLWAIADAFPHRLEGSLKGIQSHCRGKVDVGDRKFTGLDAFQKAIDSGVDMVLLCTPPGFRPMQFEAAVKAGKHVFMEKPLAVDAPGVRRIKAANEEAKRKKLLVAVGHHLRHEKKHQEVIKRIHGGAIGDVMVMRAYFNSSGVWVRPRKPDQTEMQHQVSNWYYFNWVCGDHIVEQHVHDLDVMNWIKKDQHPVEANGMGGRQVRIGKDFGEIYDHHAVEFTYADGTKMFSFCRHIPGCWMSFSEHARGTKGAAHVEGHGTAELRVDGQDPQRWRRDKDGHQTEHDDLFAALGAGKPYNEADWAADSTMTAIFGRMATYSGKLVKWDEAVASKLDLSPSGYTWDAVPQPKPGPDGLYPCAIPGVTKAW